MNLFDNIFRNKRYRVLLMKRKNKKIVSYKLCMDNLTLTSRWVVCMVTSSTVLLLTILLWHYRTLNIIKYETLNIIYITIFWMVPLPFHSSLDLKTQCYHWEVVSILKMFSWNFVDENQAWLLYWNLMDSWKTKLNESES